MAVVEIARIQVRRGQEGQTGIPQLAGGEFAWAEDTENLYIGLRRADGGARDTNVRVLTENDVRLFNSFVNNAALNTAYTWEIDSSNAITSSSYATRVIRTVQNKLDDTVSIADFGVLTSTSTDVTDSTIAIQRAIDHLFLNYDDVNDVNYDVVGSNSYNKKLLFPAGIYKVGGTIFIPRNTMIIGEGIDKTIIESTTAGSGIFQTVDFTGRRDDTVVPGTEGRFTATSISMTGNGKPKNVRIEGLTLRNSIDSGLASQLSLLSLDCVDGGTVSNVKFQGQHSYLTPADTGYTGIEIRGYSENTSENIVIDNCRFEGLYNDISCDYDVNHIVIQNNTFKNSKFAVRSNPENNSLATAGITYSRILNNKFEDIERQAIYIGAASANEPGNNTSMGNSFVRVGNDGLTEAAATTSTVYFGSKGNASINDFFDRKRWQETHYGGSYTYYPLIQGRATMDQHEVSTATLLAAATTPIMRLPITGSPQFITMKYICEATGISKIGNLEIYIKGGATPADVNLKDEYNSSGSDGGLYWGVIVEPAYKYLEVIGINPTVSTNVSVEFQPKLMM